MVKKMVLVLLVVFVALLGGCDEYAEADDERINIADVIGRDWDDVRHLLGNVIPIYELGFAPGELENHHEFDTGVGIITSTTFGEYPEWIRNIRVQFRETERYGLFLYSSWGLPSVSRLSEFIGFEATERFHINGIGRDSTRDDVIVAFYDGFEQVANYSSRVRFTNDRFSFMFSFDYEGSLLGVQVSAQNRVN